MNVTEDHFGSHITSSWTSFCMRFSNKIRKKRQAERHISRLPQFLPQSSMHLEHSEKMLSKVNVASLLSSNVDIHVYYDHRRWYVSKLARVLLFPFPSPKTSKECGGALLSSSSSAKQSSCGWERLVNLLSYTTVDRPELALQNCTIQASDEARSLGVIVQSDLSFKRFV